MPHDKILPGFPWDDDDDDTLPLTAIPLRRGDTVAGIASWRQTIVAISRRGRVYYLKRDIKDAGWSWQEFN